MWGRVRLGKCTAARVPLGFCSSLTCRGRGQIPVWAASGRSCCMRRSQRCADGPERAAAAEGLRGCEQRAAQLPQCLCWQGAPLTEAQGGVPFQQNISTLRCNSALSCRRVMSSLCEVHQGGLQDTG